MICSFKSIILIFQMFFIKQKFQIKFIQKHYFHYTNNKTIISISANPYQLLSLAANLKIKFE